MAATFPRAETDPVALAQLAAKQDAATAATDAELASAVAPLVRGTQSASVDDYVCLNGVVTPLVVVPCPVLVPGVTKMMFACSVQYNPSGNCSQIVPSINACNQDGVIPTGGGNMAFWHLDQPIIGNREVFAAQWLYDPRLVPDSFGFTDVDLGDGAGRYIGLHLTSVGGSCAATSAILQAVVGAIPSITLDEVSTHLLDDRP